MLDVFRKSVVIDALIIEKLCSAVHGLSRGGPWGPAAARCSFGYEIIVEDVSLTV